ncbi:M60 family metallopeptidase [Pseudomonas viridiflava]|uniref:M60 family metallopeptidase n=1 Tax=Pseudomonas viridiflava TaxID=33069 RepID=UPI000F057F55|nr:M60 family metallopeptidase [Pseudomonas viridiflava]
MDDRHDETAGSEPSSLTPRQTSFTVIGRTSADLNKVRQRRSLPHSDYQPTGIYVTKGEHVELSYYQDTTVKIWAVFGVPELNKPVTELLVFGYNSFEVRESGLLSFICQDAGHSVTVIIKGAYSGVPAFWLKETTNAMWQNMMVQYNNAPVVMLTSERAIIVVRYESARDYITDPKKLMTYYDELIRSQDDISGVLGEGETEWAIDPNKHLYVEADSLYMFATKGHMGFTGATALSYLLSGNPAQGWGPWHESGHQRQLSPMNWEDMTEVTVNIYSLATQERMEGRASRLDVEYPFIKKYLNSPHREFSRLPNHFQRVAMLWQLHLTFRTGFYPQLHQRYRLMQNLPQGSEDILQRFIVETSLLSGRDLSTFFDRWGIYPTPETLRQISDLLPLEKNIWETDATTSFPIFLPVLTYFPELAHIRADLQADFRQTTRFSINEKWYGRYRYNVTKNGLVMSTLNHTSAVNCRVSFDGDRCYVDTPIQIMPDERWAVNIVPNDFDIIHYEAASNHDYPLLLASIKNLFTDERCVVLKPGLTQQALNMYFSEVNSLKPNAIHVRLLHRAQRIFLENMIRSVQITSQGISVTFATAEFKNYNYQLKVDKYTFARLDKGYPLYSELVENTWITKLSVAHNILYSISVSLDHSSTPYTLFSGTLAEDNIVQPIRALFTDNTMTQLTSLADQKTVDALYTTINGNLVISIKNRADYRSYLNIAQNLLLRRVYTKVVRTASSLSVHFTGEAYKQFSYKMFVNNAYVSEITQGKAYYSSVSNGVWTTSGKHDSDDNCQVTRDYKGATYVLYESNAADRHTETWAQDPYVTHCDPRDL